MAEYRVGVLGATGAVGQKFIHLLRNHPWFKVTALGASERSAGKTYRDAANWVESSEMPSDIADMVVTTCEPGKMDVDFVFSGMDAAIAGDIEMAFAKAGIPVITNARVYRQHENVPLMVPEVNPDHAELIHSQDFDPNGKGFIVTNPNCVCIPLTTALKPIYDAFGVEKIILTSMQAVSGAGYPGVPSLDILCNIVPYIGGEEEKIALEPLKLLGTLENGKVKFADLPIHATATRVPVINGHLLSVTASLKKKPASIDEVIDVVKNWKSPIDDLNLPSAPKPPVRLYEDPRFPQPRHQSEYENGMQVGMGRLRMANVMDISFNALGHNTVRGAAGCSILNAEYLHAKGYFK
ncbi:aspartate-semialdehyde dehydrogenase [Balneolaceae bacterium ANBcel3]|nr:aspartate-semialdehyde dehydrogenase [Balneolaceae bacterium ANBcel3]